MLAGSKETVDTSVVNILPLRLEIRPFIPIQSHPFHRFQDRSGMFIGRSLSVRIFDPEYEFTALLTGKQPIKQRGSCTADMEISGRAGWKTGYNFLVAHARKVPSVDEC
jgi:hypothetical protein